MNPYLDEDLVALGGHVRRFATDRVAPGYLERDSTRVLDRGLMREMGAMGFIAPDLLSAFQGGSHPLADLDTQVTAARLLCLQALWLKDKGAPHGTEAAMCKWWAPKLASPARAGRAAVPA